MYYVYILKDDSRDSKYVGFSENLKTRLDAHQSKSVKTTKNSEMQLAFYAAFRNKGTALAFEKYLKQGSGFAFANKHLL
jgi:predicted GIY-YIG superfamily endonuclease